MLGKCALCSNMSHNLETIQGTGSGMLRGGQVCEGIGMVQDRHGYW